MEVKIFIAWYLGLLVCGIIGLPITHWLFKGWRDHGYGMAKFIGLFAVAMPVWLLASLKILPFSQVTVTMVGVMALIAALVYLFKHDVRPNRYILTQEIIFLILMITWSIIRGSSSRVEGTEKFMNLAFMNSIFRSEYFPPADPWMVGKTINYYYLGHYLFTFLAKFTGVAVSYAYNYALVTIISHAFISLFSIFEYLFRKSRFYIRSLLALGGASWICFAGNLHFIAVSIGSLFSDEPTSYFFPNATRIIPFTINEFPAYSIVLGDVHGHYLGFPFLVICLALIIASFKIAINTSAKLKFNAVASLLIAALYGINSWDFITVNVLFALVHLYQVVKEPPKDIDLTQVVIEKIKVFVLAELALLAPGLVFMFPYLLNFKAPLVGDGFLLGKYIGLVPFFVWRQNSLAAKGEATGIDINKIEEIPPFLAMWGMFIFISLAYYLLHYGQLLKKQAPKMLLHILVFMSLALIIGVEFIFFKDIFHTSNPPYFRTNTVFKFYYHAWVIWGIACTWMVYELIRRLRPQYLIATIFPLTIIAIMYLGSLVYIIKAVHDFYPQAGKVKTTMDGTYYISVEFDKPGDYATINWINENISGQPLVAEAVGDAYTYFTRISTNTGLRTIIGWPTHEWQWRGDSAKPYELKEEVATLYTTQDTNERLRIINLYEIDYIMVGELERKTYVNLNEEGIAEIADVVFDNASGTKLYKVRKSLLN